MIKTTQFIVGRVARIKSRDDLKRVLAHNLRKHKPAHLTQPQNNNLHLTTEQTVDEALAQADSILLDLSGHGMGKGRGIRSTSNRAIEAVYTFSPEWFQEAGQAKAMELLEKMHDYHIRRFCEGDKTRVIASIVHMDEKTPHLHIVSIPIKNNRLNCNAVIGGPAGLKQFQTDIGEIAAPYGLSRGTPKTITGAKHIPPREYRARLEAEAAVLNNEATVIDDLNQQATDATRKNIAKLEMLAKLPDPPVPNMVGMIDKKQLSEFTKKAISVTKKLIGEYEKVLAENNKLKAKLHASKNRPTSIADEMAARRRNTEKTKRELNRLAEQKALALHDKQKARDKELHDAYIKKLNEELQNARAATTESHHQALNLSQELAAVLQELPPELQPPHTDTDTSLVERAKQTRQFWARRNRRPAPQP